MPLGGAGATCRQTKMTICRCRQPAPDVDARLAMIMEQEMCLLHCRVLCEAFRMGAMWSASMMGMDCSGVHLAGLLLDGLGLDFEDETAMLVKLPYRSEGARLH
jgi:hypothetical protein